MGAADGVTRAGTNWHGVELRHLIAMRAVAEEQSFSAAARTLGYTQSAVSGQILALERLIGFRLFVRVRGVRPLELTVQGKVLLGHAAAILDRLEAAQTEVETAGVPAPRRLRVGSFWGVGGAFLPAICRRLGEHAFAQLELREERGVDALLEGLEQGALDVVFTSLPLPEGPYRCMPVHREPYTVVARRGERLPGGSWLCLDELASLPLLTLGGCRAQDELERVLQARGRPLNVRARLDTVAAVLAFVAEGFGVGLLPSLAVELPPSLVAVPLDPRLPARTIGLAWHRDRPLAGVGQLLVDAAREVAGTLTAAPDTLQAAC